MSVGKAEKDLWRVMYRLQREHFRLSPGLGKGRKIEQGQRDEANRDRAREREKEREGWGKTSASQLSLCIERDRESKGRFEVGLLSHRKSSSCSGQGGQSLSWI